MKSLGRAMQALKLLANAGREIGVAETARHLDVAPSTASRILAAMARGGLLDQNPATRRYRSGVLSLRLAANFSRNLDLLEQGERELADLAANTGHTTWLGLLSDRDVIVLKTVRGTHPIQFSVELGRRLPAHAAAMGKALLALKSDAEIRQLYSAAIEPVTSRTISSLGQLIEELRLVREQGYARSNQELFEGVNAIAVALKAAPTGEAVALSVSYPIFALQDQGEGSILEHLLACGRNLGARIGDANIMNAGKS